jgi:hypothetical protein
MSAKTKIGNPRDTNSLPKNANQSSNKLVGAPPAMTKPNAKVVYQRLALQDRRAFMKLPLEERRRQMAEQAERMVGRYEERSEDSESEESSIT